MPRIFGSNVMLREYKKEDLACMREWVNDPEIVDNLSDIFLHAHSLSETEKFLQTVLDGGSKMQKHFVIADRQTEEFIGQIDIIRIDWKNRIAEMGIVIGKKDLLGKGLGTEAIKLLQSFVFDRLNLNKIELNLHDYNKRAYKCYLKCGFVEEGRSRQAFYINGHYTDTIFMGILKDEYNKLRALQR
ncbi:Spermidine N(1)-acetyltransferase [Sporomusa ovata DSM 2662]|uniref:Acetyltransferase n=1 Tax=Sporomusa ovata TaxID=2378 RepID=A0A0U1KVZ5_9FIRM|nr:GNAT family protein [Sporomusa ovata]EQB29408.1 acetyltransferase, ribosomal protein N-acetylase [Sporomusa ovata DSM 2662]CQR71455.1 Acetyltransferase [Sporomusa ovata]